MIPVRKTSDDEPVPAISLVAVDLGYDGDVVLEAVDLEIPAGERVALIGPNGSGKTTLLNGIAGLVRPGAGTVKVLGAPPEDRRVEIAYVLQAARARRSLPVTVEEVVRMGRHPRRGLLGRLTADDRELATSAMDRLDVLDLRDHHLGELSGGQRQRVMVAQALTQSAAVLLLDEPLTGLDLPSQRVIGEVLDEQRDRGVTVILSTHDLSDTSGADRVVLLAGRIVASGPPSEVLVADRLAEAYGTRLMTLDDGAVVLDDGSHHHDGPSATHSH